jgi:thiol:disulfide interchange protein
MHRLTLALLLCVFATLILSAGCREAPPAPVYSVKDYDPKRDPAADLAAAIAQAKAGNKRILLQVGGEWCGWCHRLDEYFATHPAVARELQDGYVILKVNYSDENENAEFLSQFPKVEGYPHLFVLDRDGKLLHSQPTAALEHGQSYGEPTVLIFLSSWKG